MAVSSAERQWQYRQRHLKSVDGWGHRTNLIVGATTWRAARAASEALRRHEACLLEQLISVAEGELVASLKPKAQRAYFG